MDVKDLFGYQDATDLVLSFVPMMKPLPLKRDRQGVLSLLPCLWASVAMQYTPTGAVLP